MKTTIDQFYNQNAIVYKGVSLLQFSDALKFVDLCAKYNCKVLGIDSFLLVGNGLQPSLENSVDYSSPENMVDVSPRDFLLSKKNTDFIFEITY